MIQQKQQKNTRTQNARYKDQGKIGYLAKISNLPPIQTRSSSRSKFRQSIDKNSSHKKHKISDIFYEEIASKKPQHPKMNSTIIQKDSILQYSSRCEQEDKQQTVMKIHEKRKNPQNQHELCHFHQNKVKNEVQSGQVSQITSSRMRVHQCCETQPSESHFHRNIRLNMFFNRNMQSRQKLKNSFLKTPEKLKPIKFNRYQKPQLFENKSAKHISSEKISNFKLSLSPVQAKIISDKLSQPKCSSNCGKKNCQCFSESQLKKINTFKRNNNHVMSEKQMALKKINININRLKNIQNQENAEKQDQQNFNNLRRKINQKKTWRKNMKLKQIKRFDTEVLENDKFFQESIMNQNKTQQKDLSESQISSESGTFLKGALSPVKKILSKSHFSQSEAILNKDFTSKVNILKKYHTIGNETQQQGKQRKNSDPVQKNMRQEIASDSRTTEKKIIDIQNNDSQNIPSGIKNFIKNSQKQQAKLQKNGNSVFSIGPPKIGTIGYTFGNSKESENSESINVIQEIVDKKKVQKKTKQQKIPSLKQTIQYWIRFDIQRNIFVDNFQTKEKRTSQKKEKQNINLISAVVKETIQVKKQLQSKPIRQSQSTNTHEGSHILVSSTIQPMPQATIPVTIQMQSPKKSQIQLESRILGKSRNCNSSTSNKHSINMFNRSPKSLTSTKSKQYFKVPKAQECVQFVKNYKPSNPEIVMSQLVQKQGFKVLQRNGKVYFGEVIEQNIKHGLGVDMSSNEIFQGRYENGSRKNGFLKQHDGVYQGPFQNNLRHGYGTFRWNDGQIFKGQWRMGTKNGYGVWTGTDGSYYEGQWHLSMQHGKGKFVHFTSTYEGEFKNFFKEGFGKQTFPNGDIFTGEYKNGKPNGKGKYEWKDGTYYEGDFLQGLRDGFGKWHQNSHSFYEGQFKQDNKHGKGVEYFKDGSFLQGIFADGKISKGVHYNSRRQVIKQYSQIEQKR